MTTSTWKETSARRPGLNDVGGGQKENDPKFPPDPVRHPTADDYNQISMQVASMARMVPAAQFDVTFTAGAPSIENFSAMNEDLVVGDFTVTDVAAGSTQISWPAALLPPSGRRPVACASEDIADLDGVRAFYTTVSGDPAVQVVTTVAGVATDVKFTVQVF
jgi:hypothetical protein